MTDTKGSKQPWSGETGQIYITGPGGMVQALQALLPGIGVQSDDIRVEEYTGY